MGGGGLRVGVVEGGHWKGELGGGGGLRLP